MIESPHQKPGYFSCTRTAPPQGGVALMDTGLRTHTFKGFSLQILPLSLALYYYYYYYK